MIHDADVVEQRAIQEFLTTPSEEKFRIFFKSLHGKVLRYFCARGLDFETAEELGQDVLLKVYQRASNLRDRNLFCGWLFSIARNELLQHRRKHRHDVETVDWELDAVGLASCKGGALARSEDSRFLDWMASLEPQERQVMMLRYLEELDYQQIAAALEVPLGTVKWRIFHSKSKLAVLLKKSSFEHL